MDAKKRNRILAQLLIIDDDPVVLQFLTDALSEAGHAVTSAADGWQAMKCFRPRFHELVITDVCMPQVDGSDLLRVLRREVPDIPVLVITAYAAIEKGDATASTQELMQALGATRFLTKPFTVGALLAAVDECLASSRAG